METFRLILIVAWCAVLAGLNAFVLAAFWIPGLRAGVDFKLLDYAPLIGLLATLTLAIGAMIRPGLLWALTGVLFIWLVFRAADMLVGGDWQPRQLVGSLLMLAPSYLLARWHSASQRPAPNPAEEF